MAADHSTAESSLRLLQEAFGPMASFRNGQIEAIETIMEPGARLLVVQRTGWGKSAVYFIAARELSRQGLVTLVVSPLLALMRNQIEMASRFGIRAFTLNSTNTEEWPQIEEAIRGSKVDLLFISPERLGNRGFDTLLTELLGRIGLVVIDEAHCISDWGHDFRPDYRRILNLVHRLPSGARVLATTATATPAVVDDVARQIGEHTKVQRGTILRESLCLSAHEMPDHADRLGWLSQNVPGFEGTGIIYTLTIHDTEICAGYLREQGVDAEAYHSDIDPAVRLELESRFQANKLKVLAATSALGMGYDKGDVGFVVHYQLPTSMLAYYQQIGRAGRTLESAACVLLFGEADREIAEHFGNVAVPPKELFGKVIEAIAQGGADFGELLNRVPASATQISQILNLLSVDEAISRKGAIYQLEDPSNFDIDRYRRRKEQRSIDSTQMLDYARSTECRMQAIGGALGDKSIVPCRKCDNCLGSSSGRTSISASELARQYLTSRTYLIAPKTMVPSLSKGRVREAIPSNLRPLPGVALCSYNDSGYGRLVRAAKYRAEDWAEELVVAAAKAVEESKFSPEWLTWVPSTTDAKLEVFARALSRRLGIPAIDAVKKVRASEPQKAMLYSVAQYLNVRDTFKVFGCNPGRCLLVDDIVDSGWTLTVVAMELLKAGSGPVMPLALATAAPRRPK